MASIGHQGSILSPSSRWPPLARKSLQLASAASLVSAAITHPVVLEPGSMQPSMQSSSMQSSSMQSSSMPSQDAFDHIRSMPLDVLQSYAVTCDRKVKHLEAEVSRLQIEIQTREVQHARRNKQLHQSTSVREEQLSKALKQAEFELAAERSIRNVLDLEQVKLRELCKKAKDRIGELVVCRSELENKNVALMTEIELLEDRLAQAALMQEHWKQHAESQKMEVERQKFRQSQLESLLHRGDNVRALDVVVNVMRIICQQIDHGNSQLQWSSAVNPTDLCTPFSSSSLSPPPTSSNIALQLSESVAALVSRSIPQLPKASIDLSSLTALPKVGSSAAVPTNSPKWTPELTPVVQQSSPLVQQSSNSSKPVYPKSTLSSFSTSTGDTKTFLSASSFTDEEDPVEEEVRNGLDSIGGDDTLMTSSIRSSISGDISSSQNNFKISDSSQPQSDTPPFVDCIEEILFHDDGPSNLDPIIPAPLNVTLPSQQSTAKRKITAKRKGLSGLRAKLQARGPGITADELYPVPNQTTEVRKSSRIAASIRKVQDETKFTRHERATPASQESQQLESQQLESQQLESQQLARAQSGTARQLDKTPLCPLIQTVETVGRRKFKRPGNKRIGGPQSLTPG